MNKLIGHNVTARISVSLPILKTLKDDGFPLDLGALTLKLGEKDFIIDSENTDFNNGVKVGKSLRFTTKLSIDTEVFPMGEDFNYNLTVDDLKNKKLKGSFFCSDQDMHEDDSCFDFDKAEISCTLFVGDEQFNIENVELEF